MKKKIAAILLMVFSVPFFTPVVPKANAAFLDDKLAQVAGNLTATQIQELIKVKETLNASDRQALLGRIAQTALERSGNATVANNITALAEQLTPKEQTVSRDNLTQMVESTVRNKVQEKVQGEVTNHFAGYQKEIALLSQLFNNSNNLTPKAVENNNTLAGAPENYRRMLDMTATAYGPGMLDNGKWNNSTYVGGKVKKGVVAVDPKVIPMGTKLWVEGYGPAVAEDQGSAIKGNRIDLAFDTRQEALDYGIQKVKVYVLN
ncbi:hypothetical protein SRRS_27230 [Sporomusa rhizae]|uniref:3D domain-containing protein n=1 Tax=Sporomusa rhizae TaxID=357999 RepID=UPI00352A7013